MAPKRKRVQANGAEFVVTDQGDKDATPVLLLHGFPTSASIWNKQIQPLLDAGYRVIAPDLRGAVGGESYSPKDPAEYDIPTILVKDVTDIMDALGIEKAHIIGHDWGAIFAWAFVGFRPERALSLVAISCGHPTGYLNHDHGGQQKQLSWYYLLFQSKGTGEKAVATKQWTAGLATKEALEAEEPMWQELGLTETMKDPDAITGGMNWYRANGKPEAFVSGVLFEAPAAQCNVLQIYPSGDILFCTEGQAKDCGRYVKSPAKFEYEKIKTPSHFAPYTDPKPISTSILKFLMKQ